jgi:hypothetical protein
MKLQHWWHSGIRNHACDLSGRHGGPVFQQPRSTVLWSSQSNGGRQLANVLDQMTVEEHWPAYQHVNWETGDPDRGGEYEGPGHGIAAPERYQELHANAQVEWFARSASMWLVPGRRRPRSADACQPRQSRGGCFSQPRREKSPGTSGLNDDQVRKIVEPASRAAGRRRAHSAWVSHFSAIVAGLKLP